jgi:hypothetical protein
LNAASIWRQLYHLQVITHSLLVELERPALSDKRDLDDADIVDLRTHAVHPVRGGRGHDRVLGGHTQAAEEHVDDLVAPDAEEHPLLVGHAAELGDAALELVVRGRRVAVEGGDVLRGPEAVRRRLRRVAVGERGAVRVLVGIQQNALAVVVARAAVGLEREDVGAHDRLEREVGGRAGARGGESEDGHCCCWRWVGW